MHSLLQNGSAQLAHQLLFHAPFASHRKESAIGGCHNVTDVESCCAVVLLCLITAPLTCSIDRVAIATIQKSSLINSPDRTSNPYA